jgi:CxxC motif-containing protein (DUF1111 family)
VVAAPAVLRGAEAKAPSFAAPLPHNFYDRYAEGQRLFDDVGCTQCHRPMMVLHDPVLRTRSEVSGELLEIDLSREGEAPRLSYDDTLGGYPVWLFSDLKRHDLGEGAAGKHPEAGIAPAEYLTRRLWGLAESPPYFYDGRAQTFDGAIAAHGGEASFARESFEELSPEEKGSLRVFLFSLRRAPRLVIP